MNRKNTSDIVRKGALVRTEDGYYGIVVGDRNVFLANGCEEVLDDYAWSQLILMPLNIFDINGASASFVELVENRTVSQLEAGQHGLL